MVSSIQGCAPLYVDDQSLQNIGNNYFGDNNRQVLNCDSPSQNTVRTHSCFFDMFIYKVSSY